MLSVLVRNLAGFTGCARVHLTDLVPSGALLVSSAPPACRSSSAAGMTSGCEHLVWIDMEMTGLDLERCHILEVACAVTDADLRVLAEDCVVVHQPDSVLDSMEEWSARQHESTGLTAACRLQQHAGGAAIPLAQAEQRMLDLISAHVLVGQAPLAGNSVHMDRMFMHKYMPRLLKHLHYRIVDVSSLKELARRWRPDVLQQATKKQSSHRALDDIRASISELGVYRRHLFNRPSN